MTQAGWLFTPWRQSACWETPERGALSQGAAVIRDILTLPEATLRALDWE